MYYRPFASLQRSEYGPRSTQIRFDSDSIPIRIGSNPTMGAAFKWAVKHVKKNFAILKEEIGHHLQNLRAQELT